MRRSTTVLSLVAILALSLPALAQAPTFMPVQGFLTDSEGAPVDGDVAITFKLWTNMVGGQALFAETQQVLVEDGFFTVYVGGSSDPALDLSVFRDNGTLFLGLTIAGEGEMQPRLPLGAVPYAGFAQFAGDAQTLDGRPASDYRLAADGIGWTDLTDVPTGLDDGDADTLADMTCTDGQVLKFDSGTGGWMCAADSTGAGVTEAEVDAFVADNGYALMSDLAEVATSGLFDDLLNIPAGLADGDNDLLGSISCAPGQVIKWSGSSWACADDVDTIGPADITAVYTPAGSGLVGGGSAGDISLSADTTYLQRRVSATCTAGSSIRAIAEDGTVTCEVDDDTDTDTAMPGLLFRVSGGTAWVSNNSNGRVYGSWSAPSLVNGFTGNNYWSHAIGMPSTFAGRNVVLDSVIIYYYCSAGEYINQTNIMTQSQPGGVSQLVSDNTDYSGSGNYTLIVGQPLLGQVAIVELQISANDAAGNCQVVWHATYHY